MTRKRYIKLLMSCSYPRNAAKALAAQAVSWYGNYQAAWNKLLPSIKILRAASEAAKTAGKAFDCVKKSVSDIREIFARFTEALKTNVIR